MSGLSEPLLSGQAHNPQSFELSAPLDQSLKPPEKLTKQDLDEKIKEINESINATYSCKAVEFPFECRLIKLSSKHNMIIGTSSNPGSIVVIDLNDPSKKATSFKVIDDYITCIRMSLNEDKLYLGGDYGNIAVYDFPSMDINTSKRIQVNGQNVVFDIYDETVYAATSFSMRSVIVIDKDFMNYSSIGNAYMPSYVRVSYDGKYVAVSDNKNVVVYSRKMMWTQMVYEINRRNDDENNGSELKKCEIEFFRKMPRICISHDNLIDIWDLEKGEIKTTKKLNTECDITSLKLSENDIFLLAVGYDNSINIWDLRLSSNLPIFINYPIKDNSKKLQINRNKTYYDLEIDEDRNLIYTHALNSKYSYQWKGIFVDKAVFPNSAFDKVGQCCLACKRKGEIIVTVLKEGKFFVWNIETFKLVKEVEIPECQELLALTFAGINESILLVGSNQIIYKLKADDYSYIDCIKNNWAGSINCIKANSNYIFTGGSSKFIVVQNYQGILIKSIPQHNFEITAMKISTKYIITGDCMGHISIHVIDTWAFHAEFASEESCIKTIELLNNNDTLITITGNGKCIFWSIYDKITIKTPDLGGKMDINDCYLSNDERRFYLSVSDGRLLIYNLPSFTNLATLNYNSKTQRFTMDKDEKYLLVSNEKGLFRTVGAVSKDNPMIIDTNVDVPKVLKFVNGNKRGDSDRQISWVIAPYMVNSLHYYANENAKADLKAAMLTNAHYIKSSLGTPLDIALIKENTEAAGAIISQLKRRVYSNNYALETLSDCLCDLNNKGFKGLDELYNECLIKSTDENLPEFCSKDVPLPIVHYELTMNINYKNFIAENNVKDKRISFLISTIRMNLEIGSQESLDFLKSLIKCSNTDIFKTKFIQTILNEKWKKVRHLMYLNSLIFVFYLLSLSIYIITKDSLYLKIALVWNVLSFLYEIMQMIIDFIEYWKDVWNYIDISRAGFFYLYFYLEIVYQNTSTDTLFGFVDIHMWILVLITILSWIRGITLFSLSSSTRYMVSLLGEVLKDIISFAVVVFYSIISFALIKMTFPATELPSDKSSPTIGSSIIDAYFEAIGGGSQDSTGFTLILVIINSVFNVIIMMNLLISILGTTYNKVNDNAEVEDLKELTEMIIECESLYLLRRNEKRKTIMQICEEYTPPEVFGHDTIGVKLKTMRGEVDEIQSKHEEIYKMCNDKFDKLMQLHASTQAKIGVNYKDVVLEIKKNQDELKKELIITINNQNKISESTEGDAFLCPEEHKISYEASEYSQCLLCAKYFEGENIGTCNICRSQFCSDCEVYLKIKSEVRTNLKCLEEHVIYYYQNLYNYLEYLKIETNQICRFCNVKLSHEAHGCVICNYFACTKCVKTFKASDGIKEESLKCKESHNLTWKQRELYKECLKRKCNKCNKVRIGAGFFTCSECSYYFCLSCVSEVVDKKNLTTKALNEVEGNEDKRIAGKDNENPEG
ncbi:hypothetical protein SteCoe_15356 [Stentor coeruleus]|uniref:Ion transport domain-containing protein n=1 Tax=Stentor coeruleus TaxID=5963 RepID=A0A1R2C426_9CILI|nr:hypothetical protein SteCoe_15356 [Stentor coeruleus]